MSSSVTVQENVNELRSKTMNIEQERVATSFGVVTLYTLTNGNGAVVRLSSLGAGIVSVVVPDKNGEMADVALGYENIEDYMHDGPCAGKTPGRYANRIGKGSFSIGGTRYQLAVNNGPNHLHGGPEGFQNRIWDSEVVDGRVIFSRRSADGEEGYPGNLDVKVSYSWDDDCCLRIDYEAVTDSKTVVNLTNHTYFNLSGHGSGSVLDHTLWLNCSRYLPTDQTLVPVGTMEPVKGTPMDFTTEKALGHDIGADFPALVYGKGYDNCWVVDGYEDGSLKPVARLTDHRSGRVLEISSTQPAAQVYTGNWLTGSPVGKSGVVYHDYDCVAIECQGMPDAPNKPAFPSQQLDPGQTYRQTIEFVFKNL